MSDYAADQRRVQHQADAVEEVPALNLRHRDKPKFCSAKRPATGTASALHADGNFKKSNRSFRVCSGTRDKYSARLDEVTKQTLAVSLEIREIQPYPERVVF